MKEMFYQVNPDENNYSKGGVLTYSSYSPEYMTIKEILTKKRKFTILLLYIYMKEKNISN